MPFNLFARQLPLVTSLVIKLRIRSEVSTTFIYRNGFLNWVHSRFFLRSLHRVAAKLKRRSKRRAGVRPNLYNSVREILTNTARCRVRYLHEFYAHEGFDYGQRRIRRLALADELENGYGARLLDNLASQLHGLVARQPGYLDREVEFIRGDACDSDAVRRAVRGADAVFILLNQQTVQPYENST